jgi:hypothetical protein
MESMQESLVKIEAERDATITNIDKLTVEQENLTSHISD